MFPLCVTKPVCGWLLQEMNNICLDPRVHVIIQSDRFITIKSDIKNKVLVTCVYTDEKTAVQKDSRCERSQDTNTTAWEQLATKPVAPLLRNTSLHMVVVFTGMAVFVFCCKIIFSFLVHLVGTVSCVRWMCWKAGRTKQLSFCPYC